MMNGAVTLGTMDGANIEIAQRAGLDNAIIFGMNADQVEELNRDMTYNPWDIYNSDMRIKGILDSLFEGEWTFYRKDKYRQIFDELMNKRDEYYILKDFDSYVKAQEKVQELYQDKLKWQRMCLMNIANSGFFSSDRTIQGYVDEIWHLNKVN